MVLLPRRSSLLVTLLVVLGSVPSEVWAQYQDIGVLPNGTPTHEVPRLNEIDVEEKLLAQIPPDVELTDHRGRRVRMGDFFDGERPVVLTFAYHSCPSLCSLVLDATRRGLATQEWTAGKEFQVVTISIDPEERTEDAAAKREEVLELYRSGEGAVVREIEGSDGAEVVTADAEVPDRTGAEWHFLTADAEVIERLTDAAGYRYFYNEQQQQYAHPAAVMFLTPDGKVARYLYGLRLEHNDVRLALLEASQGRSISTTERLLLYCYAYDPKESGYVLVAQNIMKIGGAATVLLIAGFLFVFWRRERRRGFAGPERDVERTGLKPTQVEA